jgi:hypothetical protein
MKHVLELGMCPFVSDLIRWNGFENTLKSVPDSLMFIMFVPMYITAASSKKKALFISKLDLKLRNKLVKCYTGSVALCGAETWTPRKVDQKYVGSFEMC